MLDATKNIVVQTLPLAAGFLFLVWMSMFLTNHSLSLLGKHELGCYKFLSVITIIVSSPLVASENTITYIGDTYLGFFAFSVVFYFFAFSKSKKKSP